MTSTSEAIPMLTAPFPYFGGKKNAAPIVWERFGNPSAYIEPFCGSAAMLLARPTVPTVETINDMDGLVTNFWRAAKHAPDDVAEQLDYTWETDGRAVFLTRKSGERYQARHSLPDSRIYAGYVWHNPDLYNAVALLAALDLERSKLVFDEDRLDQLDY